MPHYMPEFGFCTLFGLRAIIRRMIPDKLTNVDLSLLARLDRKPKLFADSGLSFWTDAYISRHVLNAHLDPTIDDASRRPEVIQASADWITDRARSLTDAGTGAPLSLLDVACGPGLYCTAFADRGFSVSGIDSSESSIGYAMQSAKKRHLPIEYRCADYRTLIERSRYDAVTLIYGEFCVMTDRDRDRMLRKIRSALKPGGLFIFDVFTRDYSLRTALATNWYTTRDNGFWAEEPHLVLERGYTYEETDVHLNRYLVIGGAGDPIREYNIWRHHYTEQSVSELLAASGYEVCGLYGDLTGIPLEKATEWIGVVARRT